MKLIIEVEFSVDAMSDQRKQEIKQVVQELRETLAPYGGKVTRADLGSR